MRGCLPVLACVLIFSAGAVRAEEGDAKPAGASLKYGGLGVDLGYELVRQKGADDTKYFNFGGSFKF